jgi:hypothetical protein
LKWGYAQIASPPPTAIYTNTVKNLISRVGDFSNGLAASVFGVSDFLVNIAKANGQQFSCSLSDPTKTASVGSTVDISVSGCPSPTFFWSAGDASIARGISVCNGGSGTFKFSPKKYGVSTISVQSGQEKATCTVDVKDGGGLFSCSPAGFAGVVEGDGVTFSVNNCSIGQVINWSSVGSKESSGTALCKDGHAYVDVHYLTTGEYNFQATQGNNTTEICKATVIPSSFGCSPENSNVRAGEEVTFNAGKCRDGENVTWSSDTFASVISPCDQYNGSGKLSKISKTFNTSGSHTVTATRGSDSATCNVNVEEAAPLTCEASPSTVTSGSEVSFTAKNVGTSSGFGYFWSMTEPGFVTSSTYTSSAGGFKVKYTTPGVKNVTVSHMGITGTCSVNVVSEDDYILCYPSTDFSPTNELVTFTANGGSNSDLFRWYSSEGSPAGQVGGKVFKTSFMTSGQHVVSLTIGDKTTSCGVTTESPNAALDRDETGTPNMFNNSVYRDYLCKEWSPIGNSPGYVIEEEASRLDTVLESRDVIYPDKEISAGIMWVYCKASPKDYK